MNGSKLIIGNPVGVMTPAGKMHVFARGNELTSCGSLKMWNWGVTPAFRQVTGTCIDGPLSVAAKSTGELHLGIISAGALVEVYFPDGAAIPLVTHPSAQAGTVELSGPPAIGLSGVDLQFVGRGPAAGTDHQLVEVTW